LRRLWGVKRPQAQVAVIARSSEDGGGGRPSGTQPATGLHGATTTIVVLPQLPKTAGGSAVGAAVESVAATASSRITNSTQLACFALMS
jgi:hypothetical protein